MNAHPALDLPYNVGDRVENDEFGVGVVVTRDQDRSVLVKFDSGITQRYYAARFTRSRNEDTEFTPPDNQGKPTTWEPVDLGPYVRGEKVRPEPTIGLRRSDGLQLIYPGREHSVIGEMESGKSWFSLACCSAELTSGNRVVYIHFEEGDPADTVERLQALGVPDDTIVQRFSFVAPEAPVRADQMAALLGEPAPTLVVLDGVNEAMSLHEQGIRDEDGAAAFRRRLVKPCTAAGAATLGCDHVVKDRESRGRYALGSIHKGNGLNGVLILLENADPFGRGQRGRSHVFVTKDRPGHLRRNGRPSKVPGKTFMGELVVDDTRMLVSYLDLTFWEPADREGDDAEPTTGPDDVDDDVILAVVRKLGQDANVRNVRAAGGISKDRTDNALARLLLDGRLTEAPGPKNSRLFSVAEDQSSGESQ